MSAFLTVNLRSDSYLLRSNLRAEVRDSQLKLVATLQGGDGRQFDPGVYRISAVLGDGREYVELIELQPGGSEVVTLGPHSVEAPTATPQSLDMPAPDGDHFDVTVAENFDFISVPVRSYSLPTTQGVDLAVQSYIDAVEKDSDSQFEATVRDLSVATSTPGDVALGGVLEYSLFPSQPPVAVHFDATFSEAPEASKLHIVDAGGELAPSVAEPTWYWRTTPALRQMLVDGRVHIAELPAEAVLSLPGPYPVRLRRRKRLHLESFGIPSRGTAITLTTKEGITLPAPQAARVLVTLRDAFTSVVGRTVDLLTTTSRSQSSAEKPTGSGLSLLRTEGARIYTSRSGEWGFRTTGQRFGVAQFSGTGAVVWSVSLPSFVPSLFGSNERPDAPDCIVKCGADGSPLALIASWRTVASSVQHMLLEHRYEHAARVAELGRELLLYKYHDPVGAALGALVLLRIGRVEAGETWLRNLARDFAWLPDGRIVLAALLSARADRTAHNEALSLLVGCAEQRALFTESHSLLLKLLRRPRMDATQERQRSVVLAALAERYAAVDWNALTLTTRAAS